MDDNELNAAIAARPAAKVTPDRIKEVIIGEAYHRLTDTLTVCVLTLANGFTVTGESACASPENYDQAIGESLARKQAEGKVWGFEGYLLRERLASGDTATPVGGARLAKVFDFGLAIHAMKHGKRVARAGWNGKGMWLKLVPADLADPVAFQHAALDALPWIGMKTADDKFVPWLASQTDVLAEDWSIVE